MTFLRRIVPGLSAARKREPALDAGGMAEQRTRTGNAIARTISGVVVARDNALGITDHSALVAFLASVAGRLLKISEPDARILATAAHLHEIGMYAVPTPLLRRSAALSPDELARVRQQAALSARLAAFLHHPRVVSLIAHQYDDHAELRKRLPPEDLLLAGIFRVADVIAAVTLPRPYQSPLGRSGRIRMLLAGAGTRFHPEAVKIARQLPAPA